MPNKRVSQLVELTTAEVQPDDLFLIIDTSARESKKIQAQDVIAFLNASGSITAIHAELADTASYLLPGGINWTVPSSSFSTTAISAAFATHASTSDTSISASYARTASWAINAINGGTTLSTGSTYPITSSWANNVVLAKSSSFLIYAGFPNGTASYAIRAGSSITADSASFLIGGVTVVTASYALVAGTSNNVDIANTASYLIFSPNNGTASYALVAQVAQHKLNDFGLFKALSQDDYNASLDNVTISSSLGTAQETLIQAFGSAVLSYTTSVDNLAAVDLILVDRFTGFSASLDTIKLSFNSTPVLDQWNTLMTASVRIPFFLGGQGPLFGNYYIAVTSSAQNLKIDDARTVKFTFTSFADYVTASVDQAVDFYYAPGSTPVTFSSFAGGPFYGDLTSILATGSSNIKTMNMASSSITDLRFTWKCYNLTDFSCSKNLSLTSLDYNFPITMSRLYCATCSLTNIVDIDTTGMTIFDCSVNDLIELPALPDSLVFLKCSSNPIATLPSMPTSLTSLYANDTDITSVTLYNTSLLTGSFSNCSLSTVAGPPFGIKKLVVSNNLSLTSLPDLSPTSMSWLDASTCNLLTLPSMSYSMSFIDISSNSSLPNTQVTTCTNQLVADAQVSGTFVALGYGAAYVVPFYANLFTLQNVYGWTIFVDGFP